VNVKILNPSKYREMPWANGRGVTTELCVRQDVQTGRMLWRLSIAGVDTDGLFSHFPGYDRVLVLLEGAGLTLSHGDGTVDRLSCAFQLAAFPGDATTQAALVNGPIRDFNVITDRESFSATVAVIDAARSERIAIDADHLAIFAVDKELQVGSPDPARHIVPKRNLLLADSPTSGDWVLSGATAIVVQLHTIPQCSGPGDRL